MGQNNLGVAYGKGPNGLTPLNVDAEGNLLTSAGASNSTLNVSAATVIKAAPGRLAKVIVNGVVGTGGSLTINDCATTGAAAASNQIFTVAGTIAVGTVLALDWPCKVGIVISSVPTGGTVSLAVSWD